MGPRLFPDGIDANVTSDGLVVLKLYLVWTEEKRNSYDFNRGIPQSSL